MIRRQLRWLLLTVAVVILAAGLYFFLPGMRLEIDRLIFVLSMADVHAMRGWIAAAGAWAPVISILVMIFQAMLAPLPAVVVTFANAALFGWAYGALLSWTGAMFGAAICYAIAVGFGRSLVELHAPANFVARMDRASGRYGNRAVFVARLLPFVSFDAVSYAAGLLRLRFIPFLIATGLGQLPATLVYSFAGDFLAVDYGVLLGGILFMLLLGTLTLFLGSRYRREMK